MKRMLIFVAVALLVFFVSKSVLALEAVSEPKDKETGSLMMGPEGMAKADKMKQRKSNMIMPLMMREMMTNAIVATADGGVVVMKCNKLMKFDKDLNLVKEVELKVDIEGMEKMMMEMMPMQEQCPIPDKMMHRGKMKEGSTKESSSQEGTVK